MLKGFSLNSEKVDETKEEVVKPGILVSEEKSERIIISGRGRTLVIHNDAKIKKEAFKLTDKRLRKAGLRKYFDIETETYRGSPNNERKLMIATILREAIEEMVEKRKTILEKSKRISD